MQFSMEILSVQLPKR
uniref:Uncharacterized protein n=1 Tax=Rhizophora mucronata TaxID=61149 RepID=A0A2P2IMX7_RHIMU